jgi:hypothetical protein
VLLLFPYCFDERSELPSVGFLTLLPPFLRFYRRSRRLVAVRLRRPLLRLTITIRLTLHHRPETACYPFTSLLPLVADFALLRSTRLLRVLTCSGSRPLCSQELLPNSQLGSHQRRALHPAYPLFPVVVPVQSWGCVLACVAILLRTGGQ